MAADLHIHVLANGVTEKDLARFFSNTMGSKWFNPVPVGDYRDRGFDKISSTPDVWVGEVSWLKAALFDDPERYIPHPVNAVLEIIGEDLPVIDDALIEKVRGAMRAAENQTGYSVTSADEVVAFLEEHRGKQAFTVSW